jgi:transposase InsO family protein
MSFVLIDAKKAEIPVETACAALGVSVSGYYAWKRRPRSARQSDDMVMLAHIRAEFWTSNETYGSPRMHAELKEQGLSIGRHRVARLMSENGLQARQKTRFKRTTDSDHSGPVAANVLDRDFTANRTRHEGPHTDPRLPWGPAPQDKTAIAKGSKCHTRNPTRATHSLTLSR